MTFITSKDDVLLLYIKVLILFCHFETGSYHIVQAALTLSTLLPPTPVCHHPRL